MATGWTCPRCSRQNDEYRFTCVGCGTVRDSVASTGESPPPPAGAPAPSAGPIGEPLVQAVEAGLSDYLADPASLEFVTFSVVGGGNVMIRFTLSDGVLLGEAVAERFLPPEESGRMHEAALVQLGFRPEPDGTHARRWPRPLDVTAVAATAADVLRTYGVPSDARLHVATARTAGRARDDRLVEAGTGTTQRDARPLWRRIPGQLVVIAAVVVIGAIGAWYFNAGRSASGEITKSGDLPASELRVGDCFDLKDPTVEDVDDVSAKVCAEEHEFEVHFVGSLPEGDYPGDAAFSTHVDEQCLPAFDAYVGVPYLDSELDVFYFVPSPEAWDAGERSIQCAIYNPLISRLTGSVKGSAR